MNANRRDSYLSSWNGGLSRKPGKRLANSEDSTFGSPVPNLAELIHELQVHQEELTTQNEELRQIQLELAESRDRYQELYDSSPSGYVTLDRQYRILEANLASAQLLGATKWDLTRAKFTSCVAPTAKNQDLLYLHIKKAEQSGRPEECDLELRRADGTQFYAHLNTLMVRDQKRKRIEFRISLNDVTVHREAGAKIQESEEKYRHLFETMSQGVIYQDTAGRVISANAAAEQILGLSLEQLQASRSDPHRRAMREDGSFFEDYVHPSAIALRTGKAVNDVHMGFYNPREKAIRWTNVCATPQFKSGDTVPFQVYIIMTDITEMKRIKDDLERRVKERTEEIAQANERLKAYAKEIVRVQEAERKQIAYELHDDTVQYLSILKLQIESIMGTGKIQFPEIQDKLNRLRDDADRAIRDIRRYSHELRPTVLDHMGLVAALEQLVEDTLQASSLKVELGIEGAERNLSDEIRLAFFRIAQEALNNARKHAHANTARIGIFFQPQATILMVEDDGRGFNYKQEMAKAVKRGSLGLSSMQERAELIGARLEIASHLGTGTRVKVTVPLP